MLCPGLEELHVAAPNEWGTIDIPPDCLLVGSAGWLGMSCLRRLVIQNAVLEDASQVQPSPTLESLELVQASGG